MNSNVYIIKLVTGEEIIAKVIKEDKKSIVIDYPMLINEHTGRDSKSSVLLSKYVMFDEVQIMTLNKGHVITVADVLPELEEYYYNSIEFNEKVINPKLVLALDLVNAEIKNYLEEEKIYKEKNIGTIFISKSIH